MAAATPEAILMAHHEGKPPSRIAREMGVPLHEVYEVIRASWAAGEGRPPKDGGKRRS